MLSLDDNMYSSLCATLVNSTVPPLLNSSDDYRAFRKLIAEANAINRAWLQEPEPEAASVLQKKMTAAWQACHQWLLKQLHQNGLWCPEWFGWLAYTSFYNAHSQWQSVAYSFQLLNQYLQQSSDDWAASLQQSLSESIKRLGSIISDDNREPLLLPVLISTPLLHQFTLEQLKSAATAPGPDSATIANLESLNTLAEMLEKITEHAQRFGVLLTTRTVRSPVEEAIAILNRCLPPQTDSLNTDSDADSLDTPEDSIPAGHDTSNQPTINRERARTDLQHLIAFFRQNEPHSPVSWQLETALNCLDLSFPQLLSRMAGEEQQLRQDICRRLGMDDSPSIEDE